MSKVFEALRRSRQENQEPAPPEPDVESPSSATGGLDLSSLKVERVTVAGVHDRLIMLTEPDAAECEQFRTLRTQLFHAAESRVLGTITVVSALAGEGKTSTLLNLALAIAQSKEKRVLVIDGDLRRPSVAGYLGLRPAVGLGQVLSGSAGLQQAVIRIQGSEMYLLPVTGESSNPTELLSSERLAAVIAELRESFDFILIDSPPVMPFADARLLANHSDGVILIVRAGVTPWETIDKAIEILPAGKMLGVVLNGADSRHDAGYYDYYYKYARHTDDSWRAKLRALAGRRRNTRPLIPGGIEPGGIENDENR